MSKVQETLLKPHVEVFVLTEAVDGGPIAKRGHTRVVAAEVAGVSVMRRFWHGGDDTLNVRPLHVALQDGANQIEGLTRDEVFTRGEASQLLTENGEGDFYLYASLDIAREAGSTSSQPLVALFQAAIEERAAA